MVLLLLSGLQTRRFPASNTYMDDPFSLSGTIRDQPVYSNSSILEHMVPRPTCRELDSQTHKS